MDAVSKDSPLAAPADVVIFVHPLYPGVTGLGIAYNKLVSHTQVQEDLRRLLILTGWQISGELTIDEQSIHPEQPKLYPKTTAAMVTLSNASQVVDNAPSLFPYLQAYQKYTHIEVNFALSELQPYNGINRLKSKSYTVELYKGEGIYRYEVEIRQHSGELPGLNVDQQLDAPQKKATGAEQAAQTVVTRPATSVRVLAIVLMACGSALLLGVGVYAVFTRRGPKSVYPRNAAQR